jgi:hypothetical protein
VLELEVFALATCTYTTHSLFFTFTSNLFSPISPCPKSRPESTPACACAVRACRSLAPAPHGTSFQVCYRE